MSASSFDGLSEGEKRIVQQLLNAGTLKEEDVNTALVEYLKQQQHDESKIAGYVLRYVMQNKGIEQAQKTVQSIKSIPGIVLEESLIQLMDEFENLAQNMPEEDVAESPVIPSKPGERYKVIKVLGQGGMGKVLLVSDCVFDSQVAMKVPLGVDAETQQLFSEEAKLARKLSHPNFIPIHDLGKDGQDNAYLTMKAIKGQTLDSLITAWDHNPKEYDKKYSRNDLIRVMLKICDGIEYMHSQDIIHRDLKPQNVMIGEFGEVYVMDVGLARYLRAPERIKKGRTEYIQSRNRSIVTITRSLEQGIIAGTPSYMPPEQAQAKPDKRSDVYAIGAIAYELLTRLPFRMFTPANMPAEEQVEKVVENKGFVKFLGFPKDLCVPPELESIIRKSIAGDPKKRYQSVEELHHDLQAYLDEKDVTAHRYSRWGMLTHSLRSMLKHSPRKFAIAAATTATMLSGAVIGGVALNYAQRQEAQTLEARAQAAEAESARSKAETEIAIMAAEKARIDAAEFELMKKRLRAQKLFESGASYLDTLNNPSELEQAIAYFDQAITQDDQHSKSYYCRGVAYLRLKKYTAAIDDFTQSLILEKNARIYTYRALAYHSISKMQEALQDCEAAIQQDHEFGRAYLVRAHVHVKLNQLEEAIADFALAGKKGQPIALVDAGKYSFQIGKRNDAVKYFREYLKTEDKSELEKVQQWLKQLEH